LFDALCPARDTWAALVLSVVKTQAMQYHLDEVSTTVTPVAHAIVPMDQIGCHTTARLEMPGNLSIVCIPPATPELNPAEKCLAILVPDCSGQSRLQELRGYCRLPMPSVAVGFASHPRLIHYAA